MIQKIQAYKSSDGTAHSSLEEAQVHELATILRDALVDGGVVVAPLNDEAQSEITEATRGLIRLKDAIVDILTTKSTSLPKARKINGGTKKRTPKHIAEQFNMPLDEKPKDAA